MDALLLLYPRGQAKGDYNIDDLNRINVGKNPKYIFTGIQILKSKVFSKINKKIFPLSSIYEKLAENKRISGIVYKGEWFHIGTQDSLKEYKKMIK